MRGIVVLGSRVPGDEIHEELRLRLDTAIQMFDKSSILVLSGGFTNHSDKSEAQFMAEYCIKNGIPESTIYLEEKSLDTIGNGYFVRVLTDGIQGLTELAVVSSCYHMKRSEYIFKACFGNKYGLDFSNCSNFSRKTMAEEESMLLAEKFFEGIPAGDIESIGNRLFREHLMYQKK